MAIVSGAIVPRNGNSPKYFHDYDHNITFTLPKDRSYILTLDQSTSCTGIYIRDVDHTFHFICDFQNPGKTIDNYRFYEQLRLFLSRLVEGCSISLFIMEDIPPIKYGNAGAVLRELRGVIRGWGETIPELSSIPSDRRDFIMPQTWKSKVVNKKKGKNRHRDKMKIARDLVDIYPELNGYLLQCPSKDLDSFDAAGICHGYIQTHFGADGQRIAGTKTYNGVISVFYKLLDKKDLSNTKILMDGFENQSSQEGHKVLELNKDYPLYSNFRMAGSKYPFVLTIIDNVMDSLSVRWQFDLGINDKILVAFILRKGIIKSKNQMEYLMERYPYDEIR